MTDRNIALAALAFGLLALVGLVLHAMPNPRGLPHGRTS